MIGQAKTRAKEIMKTNNNMWNVLGVLIIVGIMTTIVSRIPGWFGFTTTKTMEVAGQTVTYTQVDNAASILTNLITMLLEVASTYYILNIVRGNKVEYVDGFKFMGKNILTLLIMTVLSSLFVTLGVFCLIIPGFIVAIGLSMSTYIFIDNPSLSAIDALKQSWELMKGYKGTYFLFILSFIGWFILCLLLIPMIYVIPYITIAEAVFYVNVVATKQQSQVVAQPQTVEQPVSENQA